jgi:predicted metal-dependent enzyme (double-stranded beta helix superfamily)
MLTAVEGIPQRIDRGSELVRELLSQPDWFFDYCAQLIADPARLKSLKPGIWPNEYLLHRSPDKSFSVLAYIWQPGDADTIHDHGSWGIVGTIMGSLREKKYERLDDGTREGYCELRESASSVFGPGETTFVLPVNQGLHAMDNTTDEIAASLNVYGRSIARGYTQFFDPGAHTVTRAYPPRTVKELLAVTALAALDPTRAEHVLGEALDAPRPAAVREEYEAALKRLER